MKNIKISSEARFCSHFMSSMGRQRTLLHRDVLHCPAMQPSQHHGSRVCQGKRREGTENGAQSLKRFHSAVTPIKSATFCWPKQVTLSCPTSRGWGGATHVQKEKRSRNISEHHQSLLIVRHQKQVL